MGECRKWCFKLASLLLYCSYGTDDVLDDQFVVTQPDKIIAANLSLNDLKILDRASLKPFSQLRSLDVSHNHLTGYEIHQWFI